MILEHSNRACHSKRSFHVVIAGTANTLSFRHSEECLPQQFIEGSMPARSPLVAPKSPHDKSSQSAATALLNGRTVIACHSKSTLGRIAANAITVHTTVSIPTTPRR